MRTFTFLILLFPIVLLAQPFQGQKFVGGSLALRFQSSDNASKNVFFGIDPIIGKMKSDRFAIGLALGFAHKYDKMEVISNNPLTGEIIVVKNINFETSLKIEPFVCWYIPIKEKWQFNVLAGIGVKAIRYRADFFSTSSIHEQYQFSMRILPAIYYFLSDKIAFNASFGGLEYKRINDNRLRQNGSSNLSLSLSSSFSIGVRYFWNKSLENKEAGN